jgi:D-amino-acid oxidase
MKDSAVAVIGAGISGLTTAVALAERGYVPRVISDLPAERAASGAAAAIWYPYEAVPVELVASWALISYGRLLELTRDDASGVSLIEFRFFAKADEITVPAWASAIGARHVGGWPAGGAQLRACRRGLYPVLGVRTEGGRARA